jgi:hypothetical protein
MKPPFDTDDNSQNIETREARNSGQIGQSQGNLTQIQFAFKLFKLFSGQALKGSIVGVVIGLSVMFISHSIFYPIFENYTVSAKYAEFISAIFVGLYCYFFCGDRIRRNSRKIFLAVLAGVVTWLVLPPIRQVFLPESQVVHRQINDTISYPISYAIICVLAGGVIETIAEITRRQNN